MPFLDTFTYLVYTYIINMPTELEMKDVAGLRAVPMKVIVCGLHRTGTTSAFFPILQLQSTRRCVC